MGKFRQFVGAAALFAAAVLAWRAPAAGWPQSFYNAAHTGHNARETTLTASNVSDLQLEWGSSALGNTVAGFALDDGVIYAESYATSNNLAAINATTGATLWAVTAGNLGFSYNVSVATGGSLVFADCSFLDSGGDSYGAICAYKRSTGKLVWQWSSPCNCLPEAGLGSPLVYDKGAVYFGYANGGAGATEYFVAADARTGSTLWTYATGGPNTEGYAAVAVANGFVYVACNSNGVDGVCALNESNGALVWSANIGSDFLGFTVGKGLLYVNAHYVYELIALNATTGVPAWTFATDGTDYPAAFANNVVYARGSNSEINALNGKTGAEIWTTNPQNISSSPSLANGVMYAGQLGSNWPAASAFDATSGSLLWSNSDGAGYGFVSPVVVNGVLYIANAPCGQICAYGLPAGKAHK